MESDSTVIEDENLLASEILKTELDSQQTQLITNIIQQPIANNSSFTGSTGINIS